MHAMLNLKWMSVFGSSMLVMLAVVGWAEFNLLRDTKTIENDITVANKIPMTAAVSEKIIFRHYKAYFDGTDVVILGKILSHHKNNILGQVNVMIYDVNDKLISRIDAPPSREILHGTGSGGSNAFRFKVRLPNSQLPGSRVLVSFQRLNDLSS